MRKHGLTLLILYLFTTIIFALPENQKPATESYFKLDNGLKVLLRHRPHTPLVNVVFAIGVGSRDDSKSSGGLVHLLEHLMLLGSTQNFSNQELLTTMRQHGIFFNAHTDHDLMTLEMSASANNLETLLTLATEKLFRFNPVDLELEKEKNIILEEINQIFDDPGQMGTSLVLQHLFAHHAYSHPIFGDKNSIKTATLPSIVEFHKKFFIPNNMSVAIVGNINIAETKILLQKLMEKIPIGEKPDRQLPMITILPKKKEIKREMDVQQCHLFFGFVAPNFDHDQRLAMSVVTQIFGRGANPMLRSALRRGRRHLVERVSVRYINLKYAGAILVHLKVKPNRIKFLKQARSIRFSKKDYPASQQRYVFDFLDNARHHLNLSYQSFQEFGLMLATSYARSMLLQEKSRSDNYLHRLQKVKSSDLSKVIRTYFSKGNHVTVIINPQDKK